MLVVDDNATNRRILTKYAEGWNMQVAVAADGPTALRLAAASPEFDVAIVDMHMPEMNGIELTNALHQLRGLEVLPVILLTSLGKQPADRTANLAAALTKPVKSHQLAKVLQTVLHLDDSVHPARVQTQVAAAPLAGRVPLRILLAEDNVVNQKVAIRLLQRLGYVPDVAADGQEVLDRFADNDYDVVLMDVQMPHLDGIETTQYLRRQLPPMRQPFIIAMTAHAMEGDRETYLAAGMDDYISKPVRIESLSDALENYSRVHLSREFDHAQPSDV
jgi:CheY-like chemotaxis protein